MRAQFLKFTLLLNFFTGYSSVLFAQIPNSEDYVVTHYDMEDGLPQNSVNEILQTRDGYIWIATFGGLARFDGHKFKLFNRSNMSCMISDQILDIFEDVSGALWLAPAHANAIVTRIKGKDCSNYKIGDGVAPDFEFVGSNEGSVWLNAFGKTFSFNGKGFEEIEIKSGKKFRTEAINQYTSPWFARDSAVYRIFDNSAVKILDKIPETKNTIEFVYSHPTKASIVLVGFAGKIFELDKTSSFSVSKSYTVPREIIRDLYFDHENNLFLTTIEGVGFIKDQNMISLNPFDSGSEIRVKTILQDTEGNYWIGTEGDGLFRFSKKVISMIDTEVGLQNDKTLSVTNLNDGKILISTNCGGIYEWENGEANLSSLHDFIDTGCYWSVFQDSKGRIWVGGVTPYMTESLDEPGKHFGPEDGYDGFNVFAIQEDSNNRIWVASTIGINIYEKGTFTEKVTEENGLFYKDARILYEDTKGRMWIGTNGGLNIYDNKKISKIHLVSDSESEISYQPHVRAIHEDEDGVFWVGTYGDGLYRIKDKNIFHISRKQGLYDNVVSHIIEDDAGFFWMGSNRGIHRTSRESLNKLADGEVKQVISYSYDSKDGMNSPETNGGFQPSFIFDSDKNIYFPTVAGVAKISTFNKSINENPPLVYIEGIRNSVGDEMDGDKIELEYDEAFLQIDYTAINFTNPDKVNFRYRLEGLSDNWIEAGSRREAVYTKIPPGNYTFQVIAANSDGVWNNKGASINVIVTPPFWQTVWFIILSLAAFGGFIGLFISRRTIRLKQETEQKRIFTEQLLVSQENERRRIASEIHDGLGQQILVIKNRAELARKQVNESDELGEQLDEIMNSAIRSIEDVRNLSHALRPIHLEKFGLTDAISDLCNQLQQSSSIEWSYHIDDINNLIPKEKEINFYRVVQEAINNILKHSLASEASVIVRVNNDSIHTVIWDNGAGFIKSSIKNSDGLGFLGMKERMETLNGKMTIDSLPGEGTTIKINIPLK